MIDVGFADYRSVVTFDVNQPVGDNPTGHVRALVLNHRLEPPLNNAVFVEVSGTATAGGNATS